jgi:hypothetical protein
VVGDLLGSGAAESTADLENNRKAERSQEASPAYVPLLLMVFGVLYNVESEVKVAGGCEKGVTERSRQRSKGLVGLCCPL